jgi:hypothetical protein
MGKDSYVSQSCRTGTLLCLLHVVCAGKAILVPLLLALACHALVPIFEVEAARVPYVLVRVPFGFVHIHFAGGALSLLHHSLDVRD